MNLSKAVIDNAPAALLEIDARIAAILKELRELQAKRVNVAMHLVIEEVGVISPLHVTDTSHEDAV